MDWAKWREGVQLAEQLARQGYPTRVIRARVRAYGVGKRKVQAIVKSVEPDLHRGRVGYDWLCKHHARALAEALERVRRGDYTTARLLLAPILGFAPSDLTLRRWASLLKRGQD